MIPAAYKRVTGGGVRTQIYQTIDDTREIIRELCHLYEHLRPTEREAMDTKWSQPRNTFMPIKHYFKGLEEMFILATKYTLKFTMARRVGKAKTAAETCG